MMIRCQFRCNSVTKTESGFNADFSAVTTGPGTEEYFKYTPYGTLNIGTLKEQNFEPGKDYFIDIRDATP